MNTFHIHLPLLDKLSYEITYMLISALFTWEFPLCTLATVLSNFITV